MIYLDQLPLLPEIWIYRKDDLKHLTMSGFLEFELKRLAGAVWYTRGAGRRGHCCLLSGDS